MTATTEQKLKRVKKGLYTYRGFEIRYNSFDPSGPAHVRPRAGHKFWHIFKNETNRGEFVILKDATWHIDNIIKNAPGCLTVWTAKEQIAETTEERTKWAERIGRLRLDFPNLVVDEAAVIAKIQELEGRKN